MSSGLLARVSRSRDKFSDVSVATRLATADPGSHGLPFCRPRRMSRPICPAISPRELAHCWSSPTCQYRLGNQASQSWLRGEGRKAAERRDGQGPVADRLPGVRTCSRNLLPCLVGRPSLTQFSLLCVEGHRYDAKFETAAGFVGCRKSRQACPRWPRWWWRTGGETGAAVGAWIGPGYHASQRTWARLQSVLPQVDDEPGWRASVLRRETAGLGSWVGCVLCPTDAPVGERGSAIVCVDSCWAAVLASTGAGCQFEMFTGQCIAPRQSRASAKTGRLPAYSLPYFAETTSPRHRLSRSILPRLPGDRGHQECCFCCRWIQRTRPAAVTLRCGLVAPSMPSHPETGSPGS